MSVVARSVAGALVVIAGRDAVREDDGARARAAVDGQVPRWVVRPGSLEGLSRVVALAHDEGLAVIPRGSGSTLELGHPPVRVDVVVDLGALDQVVEYNPDDLTVTVQAGVTTGALAARLAPHRQFLALDPPGGAARTLGGITASNASGPLRARYGTMRDLLLGVRFVQADGVLTWGGSKVVKSVSGYDVPKLMVGALGTLGVLGELTLRLHARPDVEATWLARFDSLDAAQACIDLVVDSTLQPNRVELLNADALAACRVTPGTAALAVSFGTVEAAVQSQGETLGALARRAGGEAKLAPDDFWTRHERSTASAEVLLRVATAASAVASTVRELERAAAAAAPSCSAVVTGCGVLGTLSVALAGLGTAASIRVIERLREVVVPVGGSVVVQRAPRELRSAVDPWGPIDAGALALTRRLRDEFDPTRTLNPGRFVGAL